MRAAVFHRSGLPLSIENIDDPRPLPSEMILKVCACGICGTDLHWSEINVPPQFTIQAGHRFEYEVQWQDPIGMSDNQKRLYDIVRDEELLQLENLEHASQRARLRAFARCYIKLLQLASNPMLVSEDIQNAHIS